jgi:hypothetical protein
VDVPKIYLGTPQDNLEDYQIYKEDGIILYIIKGLKTQNDELIISLSTLFKWKKLTLEGTLI